MPGDEILLINLQGTPTAFASVGVWELLTVDSVTDATVAFASPKTRMYGATSGADDAIGIADSEQKVMLMRVPQLGDVTVGDAGVVTASGWDGLRGGVVAARAASLTVGGSITSAALGYRTGRYSLGNTACSNSVQTEAGESITGLGGETTENNAGASGGVSPHPSSSFNGNGPLVASAGHALPGEAGGNGGARTVGLPGAAYGVNDGSLITMGSGPGGGLTCDTGNAAELVERNRHLAGGIILLLAETLTVGGSGSITSSAADSSHLVSASGGYVFIRGGAVDLGSGLVTAVGDFSRQDPAGIENRGSVGYIVVDATSVSGSTLPPLTTP